MANIAPTQANDHVQLTKPASWPLHMVTASLKFCSANPTAPTHPTPDAARLDILTSLNWFEAHDEYTWPDFTALGYDFSQAMRFRRALVCDVFAALVGAGAMKVGVNGEVGGLRTPVSEHCGSTREIAISGSGERIRERKRHCRRKEDSDTEVDSNSESEGDGEDGSVWTDKKFLAEVLLELIGRTQVDLEDLTKSERVVETVANFLQDSIVECAL